jgi:hypothetical protein
LNPIAAELFRENREAYYDHAKFFTRLFEKPNKRKFRKFFPGFGTLTEVEGCEK